MDYRTKPISRDDIRGIAAIIRRLFKCRTKYYFDVINAFELMPAYFPNVTTEVVSDDDPELTDVPATTVPDMNGSYCIKIKESVYEGAYTKKIGGYRNHIMHEMCHVILFILGFTPYFDRAYRNNELKPYESIEWQAKALAGEILIPYESTKNLTAKQIVTKCKVSKDAALKRLKIEK
jgi:hypothetical protein